MNVNIFSVQSILTTYIDDFINNLIDKEDEIAIFEMTRKCNFMA